MGLPSSSRREIFGPVLPLVPVKDIDEALSIIRARSVLLLSCVSRLAHDFAGSTLLPCTSSRRTRRSRTRVCTQPESRRIHFLCLARAVFRNTRSGAAVVNESVLTAGGRSSFTVHLLSGTLIWQSVSPRAACRRCWRERLSVPFVLLSVWDTCSQAFIPSDGFYGGKFAFDTFSYLRVSLNNPSWYVYSHDIDPSPQTHSHAGSTRSSASASLLTRYAFCLCTSLPTGISR